MDKAASFAKTHKYPKCISVPLIGKVNRIIGFWHIQAVISNYKTK